MTIGPFKIGLRTLKTALAVMICILLFHFLDRDTPMIACIAAVFAMREDLSTTISFGTYRIIGNLLGGSLALLYFMARHYFNESFYVDLLLIPLLVTIIIVLSNTLHFNPGIIGACATLFIIVLTVPETETFWYALARIMDTVIGTIIALLVNRLIKPPRAKEIELAPIDYQRKYILEKERNSELQQELADYKKKQPLYCKKSEV